MPNPIVVDPLSATSLRVVPKFNEIELASATAFTVNCNGTWYLVTNWHVVTGLNADTEQCLDKQLAVPNILSVNFHAKGPVGQWLRLDVPILAANGKKVWKEHPLGRTIDVVAIPLPLDITSRVSLYPLELELATVDMLTVAAMPVSVIGYPLGLTAGESWPIWKTGHIASDPDIDFEPGRPAFLVDATTRRGMSGSPVVLRQTVYLTSNGTQVLAHNITTKFMGIYSGRIHEESEIGRVWRPFVLPEILQGKLIFDSFTRRVQPARSQPCPCGSKEKFKACCGRLE
ncbi:hypothetical protein HI806_09410 [Ralstonia solanacearum]|nr:hypothetical protein HI806_09410 [Ralstonia solanacearum]QKL76691.1 hypothetical protein HI805_09420 [Ralstonia solanacearum]QKL81895.1 hypothetical protein HI804_09420 [Ralstonia solanacearum]QKL87106.1 hypothetical protein HI803_09425 [Ralstonia solanacearum]QKM02472.1 hypothetical protein HI800_09420 [Ralstonia solanacearum]